MNCNKKKVLIAIPFFNERKNLNLLFNENKFDAFSVCLIDDGSNDNYEDDLIQSYFTIKHKKNTGYGAAIKSAIRHAYQNNYDFVAILPGDNQRKFKDLVKMILHAENDENIDIVVGSKLHLLDHANIGRKFGNMLFKHLSSSWKNSYSDVLSGFKVYKVKAVIGLLDSLPDNYSFDLCFSYLSAKKKLGIKEIPVYCNYINQSSKMKSLIIVSILMIYNLIKVILKFKKNEKFNK